MRKFQTVLLGSVALLAGLSTQSASAADLAIKAPRPVAPVVVSRWEGAFVSFSGGGSWTKADSSLSRSTTGVDISTFSEPGFQSTTTTNSQSITSDSQSTNDTRSNRAGAVFTLTTGYNLVWSSWLVGIQSETSLNRNHVRLEGSGTITRNATSQQVIQGFPPFGPETSVQTSNFAVFSDLENKWTISEMGRLGFLVTPDILVYALGGWSWAGFTWAQDTAFTLNGPTWGVGVEKDFGWFRGFVQYKGIHYRDKDVDFSSPSNSSFTSTQGTTVQTSTSTTSDTAFRRFSADYAEITGGITIPLNNFFR
jgi:opacity protein-like surface antigen